MEEEKRGKKEMGSKEEVHNIVIVGGGICGLATALALHRKGINSLVLEKPESLRATGAAIGVHKNGWHALDQLRVGMELRTKAIPITEVHDVWLHRTRAEVKNCRTELRCLKRRDLIETLASNLPEGTVRFKIQIIEATVDPIASFHILSTSDGNTIKAKVLIGCDGSNSVIAKTLELEAPKSFPAWVARGFTIYPDCHNFGNHFLQASGTETVLGRIPVDEKLVHFYVCQFHPLTDSEVKKDPKLIKELAMEAMQQYPAEMIEMVKLADLDTLNLTKIWYRDPWHLMFANFSKGTTTVAGDAMHVMGPFLGQGGCCGLEDAVVLARCLVQAISKMQDGATSDNEMFGITEAALRKYVKERRLRIMRLATQTYLTGSIVAASSWIKKLVCVSILTLFFGGKSFGHAKYNCGSL